MPTVLITGANRGIGLEFARQYAVEGWSVIATVRDPAGAEALAKLPGEVRVERLDMADFAALRAFPKRLAEEQIDVLICNAGISGPHGGAGALEPEGWAQTLAVNAIAPTVLADLLVPNVEPAGGKMVAITSRMGSIADNTGGGFVAYRSSKTALNSAWRSLAIDLRSRAVTLAMLHPGWVQTDMGGPNAQISPEVSVTGMRRVIQDLEPSQSGAYLNYDGQPIPW